jgi:hypothetical protein
MLTDLNIAPFERAAFFSIDGERRNREGRTEGVATFRRYGAAREPEVREAIAC